ncbi:hypothetical protein Micbo1qcDRAFT_124055 [Microdochium bolleyi]|uniref:Uncharacterized protein n=1 Tax=Microdochium bolleyi TaxID=196109 RepID=A0A136ISQ0_9PEZI|nr:hypothetical protein Micbo1qcDRAFT_124055 [Microdochium bolleyi]
MLLRHTGGTYKLPAITIDLDRIPTVKELFKGRFKNSDVRKGHPIYKPDPDWLPPPIKDPSEHLFATGNKTFDIPDYNKPKKDLWKQHGLEVAPPLLIGFTRSWPILIQAVVGYITAGWPPELIYVVENTGVQQANARGQLTLQNPFFLNHTTLASLGVKIVTTPALLSFAQLQNFYLSLTYQHGWPYYFWSHMDALALSHEDGLADSSPKATEEGYKSMYTLAIEELGRTMAAEKDWRAQRWATRFFAYDLLTLMNPRAVEDVGGWDSLIPYYYTDCDFYNGLWMRGWANKDVNVGVVSDVSTALDDLRVLYRVPGVEPTWTDPNPPPPGKVGRRSGSRHWEGVRRGDENPEFVDMEDEEEDEAIGQAKRENDSAAMYPFEYWRRLRDASKEMMSYKQASHNVRARGRNTWQLGQHGGHGEPFFYDVMGVTEGIDVMIETGEEVYRRKWAKTDCHLIDGGGLRFDDQWRVARIKYD